MYKESHKKWDLVGGKIENGETPLEAIVREVHEELQVRLDPRSFLYLGTTIECGDTIEWRSHVFCCRAPTSFAQIGSLSFVNLSFNDFKHSDILRPRQVWVERHLDFFSRIGKKEDFNAALNVLSFHEVPSNFTILSVKLLRILLPFYGNYVRRLWFQRRSVMQNYQTSVSFPSKESFRKYCKNFFYSDHPDFLTVWETVTLFLTDLVIGKEIPLREKFRSLVSPGKLVTPAQVAEIFHVNTVIGQSLLLFAVGHDFFSFNEVYLPMGEREVVRILRSPHDSSLFLIQGESNPCPVCNENGVRTFVCDTAWRNFLKGQNPLMRIEELKLFLDKHVVLCRKKKKQGFGRKCNLKKINNIQWESICHDCWKT